MYPDARIIHLESSRSAISIFFSSQTHQRVLRQGWRVSYSARAFVNQSKKREEDTLKRTFRVSSSLLPQRGSQWRKFLQPGLGGLAFVTCGGGYNLERGLDRGQGSAGFPIPYPLHVPKSFLKISNKSFRILRRNAVTSSLRIHMTITRCCLNIHSLALSFAQVRTVHLLAVKLENRPQVSNVSVSSILLLTLNGPFCIPLPVLIQTNEMSCVNRKTSGFPFLFAE